MVLYNDISDVESFAKKLGVVIEPSDVESFEQAYNRFEDVYSKLPDDERVASLKALFNRIDQIKRSPNSPKPDLAKRAHKNSRKTD